MTDDRMNAYLGVMKALSETAPVDGRLVESLANEKALNGKIIRMLAEGKTKNDILNTLTEEGMDLVILKGIGPRIDAIASEGLEQAERRFMGEDELSEADERLAALYDVLLEDGLSADEIGALFINGFTEEHEVELEDDEQLDEGGPGSGRRAKSDVYGYNMALRHPVGSRAHLEAYVRASSVPKARTKEKRQAHVKAIRLLMGGRNSMAEIIKRTGLHPAEVHRHRANIAHAENTLAGLSNQSDYKPHTKDYLHDVSTERVARTVRGEKRRAKRKAREKDVNRLKVKWPKQKNMKEDVEEIEEINESAEELDEGVFSRGKYYARKFLGGQRKAVASGLQKRALRHYAAADHKAEAGAEALATAKSQRSAAGRQTAMANLAPSKAGAFHDRAAAHRATADHQQGRGVSLSSQAGSSRRTARNALSMSSTVAAGGKVKKMFKEDVSEDSIETLEDILDDIESLMTEGFSPDEIEVLISEKYSPEEIVESDQLLAEAELVEEEEGLEEGLIKNAIAKVKSLGKKGPSEGDKKAKSIYKAKSINARVNRWKD